MLAASVVSQAGPIVAADFNEDGFDDLVTANGIDAQLILGDEDGLTGPPIEFLSSVSWAEAADFDADGHVDLVYRFDTSLRIIQGTGTSELGPVVQQFVFGGGARAFAVGEIDGAPGPDVVVAVVDGVDVLANDGAGGFNEEHFSFPQFAPVGIRLVDVTGDGRAEIFALTSNGAAVRGFFVSDAGLVTLLQVALPSPAGTLEVLDVTDDGILDIVATGQGMFVIEGAEVAGEFSESVSTGSAWGLRWTTTADFDGDGSMDLAGGTTAGGALVVHRGADAGLTADAFYVGARTPGPPVVGDFNGDGKPDIAHSADGDHTVVLINRSE